MEKWIFDIKVEIIKYMESQRSFHTRSKLINEDGSYFSKPIMMQALIDSLKRTPGVTSVFFKVHRPDEDSLKTPVAQRNRAWGFYPQCRRFKSCRAFQKCPCSLTVKHPAYIRHSLQIRERFRFESWQGHQNIKNI